MEQARITVDELAIIEVDADPTISGLDAPIGSIALLKTGAGGMWQKTGSGSSNWTISTSSGGTTNYQIDGGVASSIYGGTTGIDGGGA